MDRLLKSADAYLARHPESAEAHYTLGRIHYLAFHLKADQVPAFGYRVAKDEPPYLAPQWMLSWNHGKGPANELPAKALVSHAAQAMHHFNEAIRLKNYEEPGLIYLGVASLEEEFLDWDEKANTTDLPPELTGITLTKIRADYAQALTVAMAKDSLLNTLPVSGRDGITSYEAASALVRLAEKPGTALTDAERKEIEKAKNALKHFASVKMGPITPMVFSFQAVDHLDALLAPETTVDFDLRGYGPRERWPWVRPDLGLLVWDPQHTGRIESARQLFGGYTFEIFRATGYDALAALDDNGDGVLSGAELDGICVWFDRNGDGVSTPDEVTPLRDLGVVSVAVTMDGYDGIHPTNGCGITLRDGRTLRTWDWMVKPLSSITPPLASAR
ncbi:MAG: hypothetical protein P4L99_23160 [Chthoniobacter sp.]|nr:hypothetical protein [Chthoniobacter sp.]